MTTPLPLRAGPGGSHAVDKENEMPPAATPLGGAASAVKRAAVYTPADAVRARPVATAEVRARLPPRSRVECRVGGYRARSHPWPEQPRVPVFCVDTLLTLCARGSYPPRLP